MKQNDERSKLETMHELDFSRYVSRHDVGQKALNKTLRRAFLQQGQQVLVIGSASVEKARVVLCNLHQLERTYAIHFVRIEITKSTTVERFIAAVSIQLGFARSTRTMTTLVAGQKLIANVQQWSSSAGTESKVVTEPVTERYVGTDDFKILEEILFNRNTILVIDDIENLSADAQGLQAKLAELAKSMSNNAVDYEDPYAKLVFIGTVTTAAELRQVVQSLQAALIPITTLCISGSNQLNQQS